MVHFSYKANMFFAEYIQPLLLLDEPALTIAVDHAGATHHGAGVVAGRLFVAGGVAFAWVIVASVFVPATRLFVAFFAPVRNNLRLLGAESHTVVDADRAGAARHGAGVCWLRALFAGCMGGG